MKRKHEAEASPTDVSSQPSKKTHLSSVSNTPESHSHFRPDLFQPQTLNDYRSAYQSSEPYHHGVISTLISDPLLRSVRTEILTHISFTQKETDIYKIQQSGDLANLDGLESTQLAHLPSLVKLRDALYSAEFRTFLENVTGAGKLSGKKTDMAINIYTPGSYLLCHDDVIGSRRVSYILYLTDPDEPWQAEWGGGLRLYATETKRNQRGEEVKVPTPDHAKVIPPSWGQLSFFAVQPGESFHDVEEVYHSPTGSEEEDKTRVRMAISGWYHIPQEGEEGYEEGLEQKLAERSSLSQLQGKEADEFDEPKEQLIRFDEIKPKQTEQEQDRGKDVTTHDDPTPLTETDLDLLLQYISPSYLTPEMTDQLSSSFEENSFLQLDCFLCEKFATRLRTFISKHDTLDPSNSSPSNKCRDWKIATPPHKHRFSFHQIPMQNYCLPAITTSESKESPITDLQTHLFPHPPFRKWLSIITALKIEGDASFDLLARRFRKGRDYALASSYEGEDPRLEFSLGCTASGGWESGHVNADRGTSERTNNEEESKSTHGSGRGAKRVNEQHVEVGGDEVYMAGDDDDSSDEHDAATTPSAGATKSDPAIYKTGDDEDDDDALLFTDPPSWNRFSVVLRDQGTLRFVKYVSKAARGDRWDIKGVVELGSGAWDDGGEEGDGDVEGEEDSEEEEEEEEGDSGDDEEDSTDVDEGRRFGAGREGLEEDEFEGFG